MTWFKSRRKILLFIFILTGIAGCWDYSVDLGQGYKFIRTNADNRYIFYGQSETLKSVLIYSDIKGYESNRGYITGFRLLIADREKHMGLDLQQGEGYFLIDKISHDVITGLSWNELLGLAAEKGITDLVEDLGEIHLKYPSFDAS